MTVPLNPQTMFGSALEVSIAPSNLADIWQNLCFQLLGASPQLFACIEAPEEKNKAYNLAMTHVGRYRVYRTELTDLIVCISVSILFKQVRSQVCRLSCL